MLTGVEMVVRPFLLIARATNVWLPTGALLQINSTAGYPTSVAIIGVASPCFDRTLAETTPLVLKPRLLVPARNSTDTVFTGSCIKFHLAVSAKRWPASSTGPKLVP